MNTLRKLEYHSKIETVEDSLKKLTEINKKVTSYEKFASSWLVKDAAERNLHRAIEAILDIGKMLVSDKKLPLPESNRQIFLILTENNLFPPEHLELVYKMIGLRNILVHGYDKVDDSIIYGILKKNLEDIRTILNTLREKI